MNINKWDSGYKKFLQSIEGKHITIKKTKRLFLSGPFYEAQLDNGLYIAGSTSKISLQQTLKEFQQNIQKLKETKNEGI